MKRSAIVAACFAIATTSASARADREIALGLSYDARVPTGSFRALVPDAGLAGAQGKWEYYAIPNRLALGFDVGYQYFQRGEAISTEQIDNGAATAPFTRYAYFFSIMPSVRWFPFPNSRVVRPYLEGAIGATSATAAILASDLSRRVNTGGLAVQPSAGIIWAIVSRDGSVSSVSSSESLQTEPWMSRRPRETMFGIATSVAWSFTTADVLAANNLSYAGLQVGIYTKL